MLVANSIVIAVLGSLFTTLIKNDLSTSVQFVILAAMFLLVVYGLIFCLFWIVSVERTSKLEKYYVLSARELEEKYLGNVKTLERGGLLVKGCEVPIYIPSIPNGVTRLKIAGLARRWLGLDKQESLLCRLVRLLVRQIDPRLCRHQRARSLVDPIKQWLYRHSQPCKKGREQGELSKPVRIRRSPKLMGVGFAILYGLFLILTIIGVIAT
jgi:hypothetical protein